MDYVTDALPSLATHTDVLTYHHYHPPPCRHTLTDTLPILGVDLYAKTYDNKIRSGDCHLLYIYITYKYIYGVYIRNGKTIYFKYMTKVRLKSSMDDENGLFSCVSFDFIHIDIIYLGTCSSQLALFTSKLTNFHGRTS